MGKFLIKIKINSVPYFSSVFIASVHSVQKKNIIVSAILAVFCEST